jgi:tRNA(Ile)-lysidine synthase
MSEREMILTMPGVVDLPDGWSIAVHEVSDLPAARQKAFENEDPFQAWVALDKIIFPIYLRARRAGDRFKPLGMEGHSLKLADFMINQKIPPRARDAWPLVFSGDDLVWIPGIRSAHPFRVDDQTQRIAHLKLVRSGE